MLIGAMNHPQRDPIEEMAWMAQYGLDFIDLTLEPPAADWRVLNPGRVREALHRYELKVVGHTPFYLPLASPLPLVRKAAIEEMKRCIEFFAAVGVGWINLHPDPYRPFASRKELERANREALAELLDHARLHQVNLMLENIPRAFNSVEQLAPLLDPLPDLGLHLDIGHCELDQPTNSAPEIIAHYGPRIRHVHLHDNKGGSTDLHLPLGAGTIDYETILGVLKASGYDGTITLEVFSRDGALFRHSQERLRKVWDSL